MRLAASSACVVLFAAAAAHAGPAPRTALNVGDSLAFGTALYLGQYLPGWRISEDVDVSMQAEAVPRLVAARGASLPRVVLVSAGTNGSPGAISSFTADVRSVLRLAGPNRCVIWANVVRPPYRGVSYDGINRALAGLDRRQRNLVVFDWAAMIRRNPGALARDGVHADLPFYRKRAQAMAALAKRCDV